MFHHSQKGFKKFGSKTHFLTILKIGCGWQEWSESWYKYGLVTSRTMLSTNCHYRIIWSNMYSEIKHFFFWYQSVFLVHKEWHNFSEDCIKPIHTIGRRCRYWTRLIENRHLDRFWDICSEFLNIKWALVQPKKTTFFFVWFSIPRWWKRIKYRNMCSVGTNKATRSRKHCCRIISSKM